MNELIYLLALAATFGAGLFCGRRYAVAEPATRGRPPGSGGSKSPAGQTRELEWQWQELFAYEGTAFAAEKDEEDNSL